jgi:hypothetical protein
MSWALSPYDARYHLLPANVDSGVPLVRRAAVLRSPCAGRHNRHGAVIRWCRRVR